jgi:plastocyanin
MVKGDRMRPVILAALAIAAQANAAELAIDQRKMKFQPDKVAIHPGDTLVFQNSDPVNHNIQVVSDDDTVDVGLQHPGQTVRQTFAKAGTFEVRCTVHPEMLLSVTVKP